MDTGFTSELRDMTTKGMGSDEAGAYPARAMLGI